MTGLHFHPLTVREVRPDTDDACIVSFDKSSASTTTANGFQP